MAKKKLKKSIKTKAVKKKTTARRRKSSSDTFFIDRVPTLI